MTQALRMNHSSGALCEKHCRVEQLRRANATIIVVVQKHYLSFHKLMVLLPQCTLKLHSERHTVAILSTNWKDI